MSTEEAMEMDPKLPLAIALVALLAAGPAVADEALAKAKGCTACHDTKKKLVGPAYADVAKKYKAEPKAAEAMAASILKGSAGKWGQIPMPPNKVSEEEAQKLAGWILTL
jgi:cytochrome c